MRIIHKYIRYITIINIFALFVIANTNLLGQTTNTTSAMLSPSEIIKDQFEEQASKKLGLSVKVSGITMGYSSIELTGIKIGTKSRSNYMYAEIEKISATCNFMSLLSGTLEITELTIISLSCTLSKKFLRKLNDSKDTAKKKLAPANELPLNILNGSNIRFHIVDNETKKKLHITIPDLSLTKSNSKNVATLKFNGRSSAGSAPLSFNGDLVVTPTYPYFESGVISLNKASTKSYLSIINYILNKKPNSTKATKGNIEASLKITKAKATSRLFKLWLKSKDLTLVNNGMKVSKLSFQTSVNIPFPGYLKGSAHINLDNGSIFASKKIGRPITNLKGKINVTSSKCDISSLSMKWGKSAVKIIGDINDLNKFNSNLTYTINPLNLNDAGKYFLAKSPYKILGSGNVAGRVKGPFSSLVIDGNINFPKASLVLTMKGYNEPYVFPFIKVFNSFKYSNGIFNINKVNSTLFGGKIAGSGKIFLSKIPIKFMFSATGNKLRSEAFLSSNSSQKNAVTGPFNFSLDCTGNVNGLNTWNGKGKMSMLNGKYATPPVVSPILSALNLKEFSSGDISTANGNFNLVNGILQTNDSSCVTNAGKAFYRGSVGLDTSLNGKMNLVFSENAVKKSQILREISKNGTTVSIPTKVRGTLMKPSFPGFKATKLLELGLKRKGEKILQELLFGKQKNTTKVPNQHNQNDTGTSAPNAPTKTDTNLTNLKKKNNKSRLEKSLEKQLKKLFKF